MTLTDQVRQSIEGLVRLTGIRPTILYVSSVDVARQIAAENGAIGCAESLFGLEIRVDAVACGKDGYDLIAKVWHPEYERYEGAAQ